MSMSFLFTQLESIRARGFIKWPVISAWDSGLGEMHYKEHELHNNIIFLSNALLKKNKVIIFEVFFKCFASYFSLIK